MQTNRRIASLFVGVVLMVLGGCAADRPPDVPQSAMIKTEGNKQLVYTSEDYGMVWVTDHGNNSIVYSAAVRPGDRVVLDPDKNRITVNDQVVFNQGLAHNDHSIFFLPGAGPAPANSMASIQVSRPADVPGGALLKAEGNNRLEYTATDDGNIWVTNADDNTLLYSGRCARGDAVVVDPQNNKLTINGASVYSQTVPRRDLRVFFQPAPLAAAPVVITTPTPAPAAVILRPTDVPASAIVRSESSGRTQLSADADGTVWLVDIATNRIVYTGHMARGDTLLIDPENRMLMLNNQPAVTTSDLPAGKYRVFFAAAGSLR